MTYDEDYMTWFYTVSHPIMTPDVPEGPPRPVNLEELEVQDEHAESLASVCRHVVEMGRRALEERLFEDGTPQKALMKSMVVELHNVVQYRRRWR